MVTSLIQPFQLCGYTTSEQSTLKARGLEIGRDCLIDPVENSRNGGEEVRFEDLDVFD